MRKQFFKTNSKDLRDHDVQFCGKLSKANPKLPSTDEIDIKAILSVTTHNLCKVVVVLCNIHYKDKTGL